MRRGSTGGTRHAHTAAVHPDHAELSSLATSLEEVQRRLTAVADRYAGTATDELAGELYEVERSLRTAERRLHSVLLRHR